MKFKIIRVFFFLGAFVAFSISASRSVQAQHEGFGGTQNCEITEFDAPDASTLPNLGTVALDINVGGIIVGYYVDKNIVAHGFLRTPDGKIIPFDAPGAGLEHGAGQGTAAYGINDLGVIAGEVEDQNKLFHGFLRFRDGSFTTFDAPGAGTSANQGTVPLNINLFGVTAGYFIDGNNVTHGFVRSADGDIRTIDAPGAVKAGIGTFVCEATCLNLEGEITGWYFDANNTVHGFVRAPDGHLTVVDAPDAATGNFTGTIGASINAEGTITGYSLDANDTAHSYLRSRDGTFTTFHVPSASTAAGEGTAALAINLFGAVTGEFNDASSVMHGFSRSPRGTFATFDAPHSGTGAGQGTNPSSNNAEGAVVGWYIDANNSIHGFLRTP